MGRLPPAWHHGAVRIRVTMLSFMIVAAAGVVVSMVRGATVTAVVLSSVAFVGLAAIVVLTPSGAAARIRWRLLAGVLVLAVTANAALLWLSASVVRGGWFGGTRLEPAAAYLSPGLQRSWVQVVTAIGMLVAVVLFAAALGPLPRGRGSGLAIVLGVLSVPLLGVAALDAMYLVTNLRAPDIVPAKVPLPTWLYLAAAAVTLLVAVLAARRSGAAALAAPGALLLALPALVAAHRAVITIPAPTVEPAGGNVTAPLLAQELPQPTFDIVGVALIPVMLVGAVLIVLGSLRAAGAVEDARRSGTVAG